MSNYRQGRPTHVLHLLFDGHLQTEKLKFTESFLTFTAVILLFLGKIFLEYCVILYFMLFPFFLKIDMINICLTRIEILHKSETIIMTFQIVWVIRL